MTGRNFSDRRGVLYPFNSFPNSNPAATKMLGKDELGKMSKETRLSAEETAVNAVVLQDLLSSISSPTVVLKMDIEGYECKVTILLLIGSLCTHKYFFEKVEIFLSVVDFLIIISAGFADANSFRRS